MEKANIEDWNWLLAKADAENQRATVIFLTDPYSYCERVSIKVESGIELEEARNQAYKEVIDAIN